MDYHHVADLAGVKLENRRRLDCHPGVRQPGLSVQPVEAKISVCFTPGEQCEGKICWWMPTRPRSYTADGIYGADEGNQVRMLADSSKW